MFQNIDALLSEVVARIEYTRVVIRNDNLHAACNVRNQPIGVNDGQVAVTHQLPTESFAPGMQPGDMLVPNSVISQRMYHSVVRVLSNVILVSYNVLTDYSANAPSEVQPAHASGSTFPFLSHHPPALVVNYTCKIGVGCSLPLESTTRFIRLHLREHGYVHKDRERASCPWQGCGKEMRWTNVARHIMEAHLGDRLPCRNCGKLYKRKGALDVHIKKCN